MNIKDYQALNPEGDKLTAAFNKQWELIGKYHEIETERGALTVPPTDFGKLDYRFTQWRLKHLAFCVIEELSEATNCLKNKPWKQSEVQTDQEHFYEEVADAFHFFVEFCITAGLDADDLFALYTRKHQVNEFRQESNY